jgi:S-adenosylmethionine:tRNA-ribosyltransferase-isomerase (queuine synthetase)
VTDRDGTTHPGEGWTRVIVTPEQGIQAVNALLTGLHAPHASHLFMLEALERRSRNQPLEIYLKYIKWISEMEKDLLLLLQGNTPL